MANNNVGRVSQVLGAVVDAQFADTIPNRLSIARMAVSQPV